MKSVLRGALRVWLRFGYETWPETSYQTVVHRTYTRTKMSRLRRYETCSHHGLKSPGAATPRPARRKRMHSYSTA